MIWDMKIVGISESYHQSHCNLLGTTADYLKAQGVKEGLESIRAHYQE